MKIYTNTFDLRQPTEKKFWVAPYSDFKIGIKVIGNKPIKYEKTIWLSDGKKEIAKDSEDNDFTYFKIKSGDTGEVTYTIEVIDGPNTLGYFTLTQVVTNSTVYEQESGGEIPSDLEVDSISVKDEITIADSNYKINNNGCAFLFNVQSTAGNFGDAIADNVTVNNNLTVPDANLSAGCINGCAIVKIGSATINGCTGEGNFPQLVTNGLNVSGGCITVVNGNGINFTFYPMYVSELFDGCGGYVLASI